MKYLLPILLLFSTLGHAQPSDFLILKKKNKPVKYFYSGSQIQFLSTNGAYRNAMITSIKNDSIFLREYLIQRVPTTFGSFVQDTVGSFRYMYRYTQIKSFYTPHNGFNVAGSGTALFGGGILLVAASGVSYLADKNKFSPQLLVAALTLGTAGYFMSKVGKNGLVIGRKYSLHYMNMTTNKESGR
jgi:hypothetical protein